MRYFLIGASPGEEGSKAQGLILVLPGGDGSADFNPFVRRIAKNAVPGGCLVAQLVARNWKDSQVVVWPTEASRVPGMEFTTERFVEEVITDVARSHRLDEDRIFTLTWSSSGPAAYQVALRSKRVKGSLIAMSVFKPETLPPLERARKHAFFLYHSPEDRVCPFRMAEQALEALESVGARVTLVTYEGGHGWRGPLYHDLRRGFEWLDKEAAKGE